VPGAQADNDAACGAHEFLAPSGAPFFGAQGHRDDEVQSGYSKSDVFRILGPDARRCPLLKRESLESSPLRARFSHVWLRREAIMMNDKKVYNGCIASWA
jgi:hypothetical protein